MTIKFYFGERNYSSWSMRPWLVLKWSGLPFEEHFVSLDQPGYGEAAIAAIRDISPSGRVPSLSTNGVAIWDSLAMSEWIAEQVPQAELWPTDMTLRANARAVTCEMHSGFSALRRDLPMNIRRRCSAQEWGKDVLNDLARLNELWSRCRTANKSFGPFLFGRRCIADAFFAPVATRLRTYSVNLGTEANAYRDTLLNEPAFKLWEQAALSEWKQPFTRSNIDRLYEK